MLPISFTLITNNMVYLESSLMKQILIRIRFKFWVSDQIAAQFVEHLEHHANPVQKIVIFLWSTGLEWEQRSSNHMLKEKDLVFTWAQLKSELLWCNWSITSLQKLAEKPFAELSEVRRRRIVSSGFSFVESDKLTTSSVLKTVTYYH